MLSLLWLDAYRLLLLLPLLLVFVAVLVLVSAVGTLRVSYIY